MSRCDSGWLVWTGFFRPQGGARGLPTWHGTRTTVIFSELIPPNLEGNRCTDIFCFIKFDVLLVCLMNLIFYMLSFCTSERANEEKSMITSVADSVFPRWGTNPTQPIITSRKWSLRRLCFHRCLSVHGGLSLCPGSLCPGGSLSRGSLSRGGLCPGVLCAGVLWPGGLCPTGSLFRGICPGRVSIWGVSVRGTSVLNTQCIRHCL